MKVSSSTSTLIPIMDTPMETSTSTSMETPMNTSIKTSIKTFIKKNWPRVLCLLFGFVIAFGGVAVFLWVPRTHPLVVHLRHPNQDYLNILKATNKWVLEKDEKKRNDFLYQMREIWVNPNHPEFSTYFTRLPRDDYVVLTDEHWGVPLCIGPDRGGYPRDGKEMEIEKRTFINNFVYECDYKFRGTDPIVGWYVLGIALVAVGLVFICFSFSSQK